MFRALSTRRSSQGYDRLVDDPTAGLLEAKLSRSRTTTSSPGRLFNLNLSKKSTPESNFHPKITSPRRSFNISKKPTPESNLTSPGRLFNMSKKTTPESNFPMPEPKFQTKQVKKASKIHPLFSLFEKSSRKKPTAKPEFARYVQYLKEGGVWDSNSANPVIF